MRNFKPLLTILPEFPAALIFSFILLMTPAAAQPSSCNTMYEAIIKIRPPAFGYPAVWDTTYEKRGSLTELYSGVAREDGTVLTYGRALDKTRYTPARTFLATLNRRGRAVFEKEFEAREREKPVKLIKRGNQYVTLSGFSAGPRKNLRQAALTWLTNEGAIIRTRILRDETYDYVPYNIIETQDRSGILVMLRAVHRDLDTDRHSVLIRYDNKGNRVWRRAYRVGIPNVLYNITPIDDGNYLALGSIQSENGGMAGWVMKLGPEGTVFWQKNYPRGMAANVRDAVLSDKIMAGRHGFIVTGEARAADDGNIATWVMSLDTLGETRWQRYFRHPDYDLRGHWLMRHEDKRLVLIINAEAIDDKISRNHIRMLTLSPRAEIIDDESYVEGIHAKAHDFVETADGKRVVIARVESGEGVMDEDKNEIEVLGLVADNNAEENETKSGESPARPEKPEYRGWVLVATALGPYDDPCTDDAQRRR